MNSSKILSKIDRLDTYTEKLEYLNGLFLKAKTLQDEILILKLLDQLHHWGH